jgi:hypothetical protein
VPEENADVIHSLIVVQLRHISCDVGQYLVHRLSSVNKGVCVSYSVMLVIVENDFTSVQVLLYDLKVFEIWIFWSQV